MPGPEIRRLLELDPELGAGLEALELSTATAALVVRVVEVEDASSLTDALAREDVAAVLVVRGLITSEIRLGERPCARLHGPGSLLSPQVEAGDVLESGEEMSGSGATVALVDRALVERAATWPAIAYNLLARASDETRRLAIDHAIAQLPRAEDRLLYALWHLAERWGRVTRSGVDLPLRLTHETLGRLTGSKRPSVTLALGLLIEQGRIVRGGDGGMLLVAPAPELPLTDPWTAAPAVELGLRAGPAPRFVTDVPEWRAADVGALQMRIAALHDAEQHAAAWRTVLGAEAARARDQSKRVRERAVEVRAAHRAANGRDPAPH
jgi:CRP/FNR family transcriptional regulator, cyclic AMP receptor protein